MRRAIVTAALLLAPALAAQYRGPRGRDYLFLATTRDTRALWVNPGGLGARYAASIMAEVVADRSRTGDVTLNQFSAGLNSRGLALGYTRDQYNDTLTGHTWRLGLGTTISRLAIGASLAFHSNGDGPGQRSVALGAQYAVTDIVVLGGLLGHIGKPVVHDSLLDVRAAAGVAVQPVRALTFNAQADLTFADTTTARTFQAGITWTLAAETAWPVAITAVLAMDRDFGAQRLTLGLTVGGRDAVAGMVSGARPGGTLSVDAISVAAEARRIPR